MTRRNLALKRRNLVSLFNTLPRGVKKQFELQVHILHHSSMTVAVTLKPQQERKPPFKRTSHPHSPESRRRWRVIHFTTKTTYTPSPKVFCFNISHPTLRPQTRFRHEKKRGQLPSRTALHQRDGNDQPDVVSTTPSRPPEPPSRFRGVESY